MKTTIVSFMLALLATPAAADDYAGERHVGVSLDVGAAILPIPVSVGLAVDVQRRGFYGFAHGDFGFSFLPTGAVGVGAGPTFAMGREARFDLFTLFTWTRTVSGEPDDGRNDTVDAYSLGVGIGYHLTSKRGFTFAFKLPIVGLTFSSRIGDALGHLAWFYPASMLGLPLFSFGHRF